MTVVRVWGIVDGVNVIFSPTKCPDWWDVDIPFDEDGMYIAEIWAEDDEGFITYRTAILYITDGRLTQLCLVESYYLTYCTGFSLMLTSSTSGFSLMLISSTTGVPCR